MNSVADIKQEKDKREHDQKLWVSTGKNRFESEWKNKRIYWSDLLRKLESPTRTSETVAEYKAMSKDEQLRIKDVGGFVGGQLEGGQRNGRSVRSRDVLAFDLDNAPKDFPEWCMMEMPYRWALYSTHKHTPDKPRYRLLLPLDREVSPDEFQAIGRKVGERIGMQYLDHTTFQPHRLMFWPSVSADGEYVYESNEGEPIKADEVLSEYPDWTDQSYWALCPDEIRVGKDRKSKQQNPLDKRGMVGAFCRTYSVPDVISEYLSEVYEQCEGKPNRYTYKLGSTAGGLVIYDDGLFAYSNHATDPASGMDLNAFDLVRVHRFSDLDDEVKPGTRADRMPSYMAMCELAAGDQKVRRLMREERMAKALEDFDGESLPEEDGTDEWQDKLAVHPKTGEVLNSLQNLQLIMINDKSLKGLAYNEMEKLPYLTADVPWRKMGAEATWSDMDESNLYVYLSNHYADFRKQDIQAVVDAVALKRAYHPIRDYLNSLPAWDGVERAKRLFIQYLGAEDCEYVREVTALWLTAAVARIYQPGIKFDNVIVLSGPGGIGKSTLLDRLGMEWFSDSLTFEDMKGKEGSEKIQSTWINEIAELKGMRKVDVESVKSFISRRVDKYRPSYGRHTVERRRRCVFIGTSNNGSYLKDLTGNRRFWPVPCEGRGSKKAWDLTKDEVAQIWAEVREVFYEMVYGTNLYLSPELEEEAAKRQTQALEGAEQEGMIGEYLDRKLPIDWDAMDTTERIDWLLSDKKGVEERQTVCVAEIWSECFRMADVRRKRSDSDEIVRTLLRLGWVPAGSKRVVGYGVQACFIKAESDSN